MARVQLVFRIVVTGRHGIIVILMIVIIIIVILVVVVSSFTVGREPCWSANRRRITHSALLTAGSASHARRAAFTPPRRNAKQNKNNSQQLACLCSLNERNESYYAKSCLSGRERTILEHSECKILGNSDNRLSCYSD